jgi:hypothetical protein
MPRNPFRNPVLKGMYDESLAAYRAKGKTLFLADGTRNRGNAIAGPFWNGFDGLQQDKWDASSRKMPIYAAWRAGRDAARFLAGDRCATTAA